MASLSQTAWLARRAMLAIALMVGFYVLAAAVVFVLLWIPYAEFTYLHRVSPRLAFFCVVSAIAVLLAIVPRRDRFVPPGPRLDPDEHPRLFAMVREVAAATGQEPPHDVYVINDVNAWVAQRGGVMGFGGQRVMGLGLPLLQALSVTELRAVVAHEFGHYQAGDVKLGPWIYKTRGAIARAVAMLDENAVGKIFVVYGHLFMRLTMAISRQQEFVADAVAARTTSAADAARALRRVAGVAQLFPRYLHEEVGPVLNAGFLPPLASGFDQFLRASRVQQAIAQYAAAAETSSEERSTDTHPSLADRLKALGVAGEPDAAGADERPAADLIADVERVAQSILAFHNNEQVIASLRPIAWDAVPEVFIAQWRNLTAPLARPLASMTPETIGIGESAFVALGRGLVREGETLVDRDAAVQRAVQVLGPAIGLLLIDSGWTLTAAPGEPMVLHHGDQHVHLMKLVTELVQGTTSAADWQTRCLELGISGRPLASALAALE